MSKVRGACLHGDMEPDQTVGKQVGAYMNMRAYLGNTPYNVCMCGWSIPAAFELSLLSPEQLSPSVEWLCLSQPACQPYSPTGTGNHGDDVIVHAQ